MNDLFYTETGERADIAASLVPNPPHGYIGTKLMPITPMGEKSGTLYYATLPGDQPADTTRQVGSAPASAQLTTSNTTFLCAELSRRVSIAPDEAKSYGGIEKADEVGAKSAVRSVMNAQEALIAAATLGKPASAAFDAAKFFEIAQGALTTVRLYSGKTVLYGAAVTIKKAVQALLADKTFGPVLSRTISGTTNAVAAAGLNEQAWYAALALLMGVDEVLPGDDTIWAAGSLAGKIGLAKIDDGASPMSHKWEPVLGKTFQFLPDGSSPFVIQAIADRVNVNNHYDCYSWVDVKTLNTGANYTFDGI